jgi:hypothetical protein
MTKITLLPPYFQVLGLRSPLESARRHRARARAGSSPRSLIDSKTNQEITLEGVQVVAYQLQLYYKKL